jgi:hypothetical protein
MVGEGEWWVGMVMEIVGGWEGMVGGNGGLVVGGHEAVPRKLEVGS